MKRTVKAVGALGSMGDDATCQYLTVVQTYGGEFGDYQCKQAAKRMAKEMAHCGEKIVDCLVTFDDGTKPKKGRRK